MSWIPLVFTTEIRLEQHFRAKGNVRSDSDDDSVWELVGKKDLLVDGASAFSSFVMRSTIPWKIVVPLDNTTLSYADVNVTLHDVLERSVVDSAGLFANETMLETYFKAMETPGVDRDDVSVGLWLGNSAFDLCTVS